MRESLSQKRTYTLLKLTLFDLLSKMSFEKISLTLICNHAMIPRSTFYRYFDDKYDLLDYCVDCFFESFGLKEKLIFNTGETQIKTVFMYILKHFEKYFEKYKQILIENKDGVLISIIKIHLSKIFKNELEEYKTKNNISHLNSDFYSFILSDIYSNIIIYYLENKSTVNMDTYVDDIYSLITKDFLIKK